MGHTMVMRNLLATQRALLILLTRACRTTITVSMMTADKLPIDLQIIEKGLISKIKRNLEVNWELPLQLRTERRSSPSN